MRRLFLIIAALCSGPAVEAQWTFQTSGTTARLRGVAVVDGRVAWASGTGGTVLLTTDRGATWRGRNVPNSGGRDFRDVEAFDDRTALVLSIGEGDQSRIFKTTDGGETWRLRHVNADPKGFLDGLAFSDARHGLALGDPVDGRFVILATDDGGDTWARVAGDSMPAALPREGAFAASGTCLAVKGDHAWFGTSGGRIFRSDDRGRTWTAHATPLRAGEGSSGVFSLAFRDAEHGAAVGGDYKEPDAKGRLIALTHDGGRTWIAPSGPEPSGYRSAVAFRPGTPGPSLIAVGPTGADRSDDGGESWSKLGDAGFHAVGFAASSAGWAVGERGRIARFDPGSEPGPTTPP
ncbi:WD40/YVTN/BNR-like repeat-containing protein [Paludisphaera mucosa]|uniref:YCF48-related protein n=1 Tax=Paludisphaera mucosa TaxID=3030827 RepID=A0ABT6FBP6_9BACT|nr:YCF48-related protein [Paludisphaera mucosa]MDG3005019.1 YCF48-related protein [Paludisphaera mucosa]